MKTRMVRTLSVTLGIASTLLVACRYDAVTKPEEIKPVVITQPAGPMKTPGDDVAERRQAPPPATLSPGLAEVVKLAQAGIEESVLLAYVENSGHMFNPTSDELVYLSDMGISGKVLAAMIQRDKKLNNPAAVATLTNAQPAATATAPAPLNANPAPAAPSPSPAVVAAAPAAPAAPTVIELPPPTTTTTTYVVPVNAPTEVTYFYEPLAPYGSWLEVPNYGWCWQPTVSVRDNNWRPYSDRGRWIYSDCGWYWQSDYSWGWAPFHYGRWMRHTRHGWVWLPGTTWSAAWVTWRNSDTHCGWAPLPPAAHYDPHFGFRYHDRAVWNDCDFGLSAGHFTFISKFRFLDRNPSHYYLPPTQVNNVYNNTVIINNYTFERNRAANNGGLAPDHVAAVTRAELRKVSVRPADNVTVNKPDRLTRNGSDLVIYRPEIEKMRPATGKPAMPFKDTTVGTKIEGGSDRITITKPGDRATAPNAPANINYPGRGNEGTFGRTPGERKATRTETGAIAGGTATRLAPPQPITSTPTPLAAPQPITSTPTLLAPPQPITSTPQPLRAPEPIRSTPRPLTPPQPVASIPERYEAPQPIRSTPQPLTPPQPVRSYQSPQARTEPRPYTAPQPAPSYTQPARTPQPAPSYTQPAPTPPPARSYTAPAAPAYTPPSRPAPAPPAYSVPATPAPAPRISTPPPAPAQTVRTANPSSFSQQRSAPAPVAPPPAVREANPGSFSQQRSAPQSPAGPPNDGRKR